MSEVECVWPIGAVLGEGPLWSAAEQAVWFVDIKAPAIHRFHPSSGERRSWPAPARVGFLAPTRDGGLIAGLKTGLHRWPGFTFIFSVCRPKSRGEITLRDAEGRTPPRIQAMPDCDETTVNRSAVLTTSMVRIIASSGLRNAGVSSRSDSLSRLLLWHLSGRRRRARRRYGSGRRKADALCRANFA